MRRFFRKFMLRCDALLHRARYERELAEEMESHRAMMPAERRLLFGNAAAIKEEARDEWSWVWLEQFWQDARYGVRVLRSSAGYTLGAIAILALGIGVNLGEFQIFDALIFHRLTVRDADSILLFARVPKEGHRLGFPPGAVELYRTHARSFEWLITESQDSVVAEGDPDTHIVFLSPDYFRRLGVAPAWGRLLDESDAEPGAPPVAVLGYEYWRNRWGSDPHVVGRTVHINDKPVRIAGVLPADFAGLWSPRPSVWMNVSARSYVIANSPAGTHDFLHATEVLFGKLKPGTSAAAGQAELVSLTRAAVDKLPKAERDFRDDERIMGELLQESVPRAVTHRPAIAILVVMMLLVLLSACANLGNMLLARGLARRREIEIRLSIGAGRARLVRQLMTENLLLALAGSAVGLVFGTFASRLLLNWMEAPPDIRIVLRWQLVLAGFVLSLISATAFGLPAALRIAGPKHERIRLRQSLVGIQVAVSCLLLIASAILAHNGAASAAVNVAFDYQKMAIVYPQFYARKLSPAQARERVDALATRLQGVPGVDRVIAAVSPPLGGRGMVEHVPGLPNLVVGPVGPGYFEGMKLPFVRGGTFPPGREDSIVLSESAARAVFPNEDPLGRSWNFANVRRTVFGVVKDSGANLLADSESIEIYVPIAIAEADRTAFILHTRGDPDAAVSLIPGAAATLGETVAVSLMKTRWKNYIETQSRLTVLIGSIGGVASVLAAVGMFALIAFAVAQRRKELGIRLAIGAKPRHILGVLVRQNVRATIAGALAGSLLAVVLSRLVRSLIVLQNHDPVDPIGFAAGLAGFSVIALLATLSPAMRALRIDPSKTLREE